MLLQLEPLSVSLQFVPVIHYGTTVTQCNDITLNTQGITLDYTSLNFRSDEGYGYKVAENRIIERHSGLASLVSNHLETKWVFGKALLTETVTEEHTTIVEDTNFEGSLQKSGEDVATQNEIDADRTRLSALERGASSGSETPAVREFHEGLTPTHTANTIIRVAPYNSGVRFKLNSPTSETGDTTGIVKTNDSDNDLIEYSGLSDDIYKVIALEVRSIPVGDVIDLISYRIPEHNNIGHHLIRVNSSGKYVLGNPDPTSGGRMNDVVLSVGGATIDAEAGDWVIISPSRLANTNNGVEFNVVIRRSNGTFEQANTVSFADPLALAQLHLNKLLFHTSNTDNTQAEYLNTAVVLEHSGVEYISHSDLTQFDFNDPILGKRRVGEGQDELSYDKNFRFEQNLDVDGNLKVSGEILNADGNPINTGGGGGTGGLDQAQVDARVKVGVKNYAETGNTTDKIPETDLDIPLRTVVVDGRLFSDDVVPITITPTDMSGFTAPEIVEGTASVTLESNAKFTFNASDIGTGEANAYEFFSWANNGWYIYKDGENIRIDARRDDGTRFDDGGGVINFTFQIRALADVASTGSYDDLEERQLIQ